jgi:hypothetical protein
MNNIDTLSPHAAPVTTPARSVHTPVEQAIERPVERPHRDEPANNQQNPVATPVPHQAERSERTNGDGSDAARAAAPEQNVETPRPTDIGSFLDVMV